MPRPMSVSGPISTSNATAWRQIRAADITGEENTGLKTSIADVGDEVQYRGSAATGSFKVENGYRALLSIIDPDTGNAVDWSAGNFLAMEVWISYGTNYPDANKNGALVGVLDAANNQALAVGTTSSTSQHRICAATYGASSIVTMTWGADDRVYGWISLPSQAGGSNVLLDMANALQMDDSTSPARVQSAISSALVFSADTDLTLVVALGGDIDLKAYYRLIRTPTAPA